MADLSEMKQPHQRPPHLTHVMLDHSLPRAPWSKPGRPSDVFWSSSSRRIATSYEITLQVSV